MTEKDHLRRQAEEIAQAKSAHVPQDLMAMTPEALQRTFHELQVHQIQLELQNEELRRTQDDLQQSQERYFDLYDLAPVGYLTLNDKGAILEANLTAASLLGVPRNDLVKQPFLRFILPEDQHGIVLLRQELEFSTSPLTHDLRMVASHGKTFWGQLTMTTMRNRREQDTPAFRVALSDISARKETEEALRQSENKYRLLIDNLCESIIVAQNGYIRFANHASRELFGATSEDELVNRPYVDFIAPDDREKVVLELQRWHVNGQPLRRYALNLVTRDGVLKSVEASIVQMVWQGKPANLCFLSDTTERRKIEEALARKAALLARAEAIAHGGSWRIDLRSGMVSMSDEMHRILGIDGTTFSHDINDVIPLVAQSLDTTELNELQTMLIQNGQSHQIDFQIITADGSVRWCHTQEEIVQDENGNMIAIEGFTQDITEHKLAEDTLNASEERLHQTQLLEQRRRIELEQCSSRLLAAKAEELARSNKELAQFAYVASHDLQEPLRMVTSYVQLLAERYSGKLDERADKYIGYAADGAVRMSRLIQSLLTYSRVSTQTMPFKETSCTELVAEAVQNLGKAIAESGAEIIVGEMPTVIGDRSQLGQVFQNLLSNAIKFRNEKIPKIEVTAQRKEDTWEFCVADNGIGIDPRFFDRVFVIFQRLHQQSEYEGNGIGLPIVKKILERHEGRIWIESALGEGARFKFTLPVQPPEMA
ncbi:MAG: PAS domain-containing sensor histidine kinase [Anaerolineae bacterium]